MLWLFLLAVLFFGFWRTLKFAGFFFAASAALVVVLASAYLLVLAS